MLSPKRTKYRKQHKGRIHGVAKGGTTLNFGAYGLKAQEPARLTARQIEAARRAVTRRQKAGGPARAAGGEAGAPPPRNPPPHQASGPRLDPDFPGRARLVEACRS